ncbi:MAG: glycosyltransferase [Acidobacteriota bacterium]|nr:glycosyltransferase [Acidobacteriota bacterium]
MKRVLVVHPYLAPAGGSNVVAAWALQALREEFEVGLATLRPVDVDAVNRSFGTSLRKGDFQTFLAPSHFQFLLRAIKNPGALLDCQLTVRLAQNLDRRQRFDVLISTHNEVDFGRRGIQYVNLPNAYLPRPSDSKRFSHYIPGLHRTFRAFCFAVGRYSGGGLRRNLFLADSGNIARQIREQYGVDSKILYPPVAGAFPAIPWAERRSGFIAVGRIARSKCWHVAVEILDRLRAQGHVLTLSLIGHREDDAYEADLRRLSETRPWFRLAHNLSREELVREIASHRYGIHTMPDEHFGIGPAEILSAGCLPFVHNSGGPAEIVGHPQLTFETVEDAIEKIGRVLGNPEFEAELLKHAAKRRVQFTSDVFCTSLRDIVRRFE